MIDLTEFNLAVDEFLEDLDIDAAVAQRKLVMDILAGVVPKTPVDEGKARGGWQVTIATPATEKKQSSNPISDGERALAGLKPYGLVWITNNEEHIAVLEFGLFTPPDPGPSKDPRPGRRGKILVSGGFSTQAPQGMVRTTLIELLQSIS